MWRFIEAVIVIILAAAFIGSNAFPIWADILIGIALIIALIVIFIRK